VSHRRLILASTSPRRRQMLENLGLTFEVVPPAPEAELPLPRHLPIVRLQQQLTLVSQSKAADVLQRCPFDCLVLAADTVVYAQGQVLGKPGGNGVARQQLRKLRGKTHRVLTAVTVGVGPGKRWLSALETTEVRFRAFSDEELEQYLGTGEPLDKAGSYGIQGWGGLLVETIRGRYDNVVGFPLVLVQELLAEVGASLYEFQTSP
jgi:septum formation protein